jgi:hypothetical protein
MKISEIVLWKDVPAEGNGSDFRLGFSSGPLESYVANLASAFTAKRGLVKYHWNVDRSEEQPSGPAPPNAGNELIPSGSLEPIPASVQAEQEPAAGQHPLAPSSAVPRGLRRQTWLT